MKSLEGKKFGRLFIIKDPVPFAVKNDKVVCECKCGKIKTIQKYHIINKKIVSCGCFREEQIRGRPGEAFGNSIMSGYKNKCKRRNIKWNLSKKCFIKLIKSNCFYCGGKPDNISPTYARLCHGSFKYNGIDRKNNNAGYSKSNSLSCCKNCNYFKNAMDFDKFILHVKKLYVNLKRNKLI